MASSLVFSVSRVILVCVAFCLPLPLQGTPESPFHNPNAKTFSSPEDDLLYPLSPVVQMGKHYLMKFGIGTPPLETFAIPDTASNLIWLQCGCTNCYTQTSPTFDPKKSSTYESIKCSSDNCKNTAYSTNCNGLDPDCSYNLSFQDIGTSSRGHIAMETLMFQDGLNRKYPMFKMIFGCGQDNKDTFGVKVPGIMGLSNHSSSLIGQSSFIDFSYIFFSNASIGRSEVRIGFSPITGHLTTALAPNSKGLYIFKDVDGIYVEGEKVDIPESVFGYVEGGSGGLIIDTGATFTELNPLAFDALIRKVKDFMPTDMVEKRDVSGEKWELCYDNKYRGTTDILPEIEFRFRGTEATFPLKDKNAWIDNNLGQFCLAIKRGVKDGLSRLGMFQQRDINVGMQVMQARVSFNYQI
ncbi:hypothetical protein Pint_15597 [Pistacia integerrima]|uniref:Uncharacterized protein n=1 Tax=Pistacia integerrima TaxID=434235 RepID=A0ACC0ZBK7_9ROSI|nr:hypothetical protein Pint_15597 [Pistacia integerrima]